MLRRWRRILAASLCGLCLLGATHGARLLPLDILFNGASRPDDVVETLSHFDRLTPVAMVKRSGPVSTLPVRAAPFPAIRFEDRGDSFDLHDYLATNRVAGLLVLKNGEIALEDYELGFGPQSRWASFSVAKSIASTLAGAAIRDGHIRSIDDPVDHYVPALKSGAYAGVSIRNILTMSSGVAWDETYTDPKSDRRKLLALQLFHRPGDVLRYMNGLGRAAPQGTLWHYSTGETYVLGAVIEGATHRPLAHYLSEKIWAPAGMESDATWWQESPGGMGLAGGGLTATLRDYGRFGLIAENGGKVAGRPIVPDGWFAEAGAPHMIGGKKQDYGFMWWMPTTAAPLDAGAFEAVGIFGQFIYVNPAEHVVIVVLSARSKPSNVGHSMLDDDAFFSAVVKALHDQ